MSETADQSFQKATLELLIQKCYAAAGKAHVPYSKFPGNVLAFQRLFYDLQTIFLTRV